MPDGPPETCAFCDGDADEEIEVFTMGDYMDTPFGGVTPGYHVGICWHHLEQLEANEKTEEPLIGA